jgi:hypothetical protein
MSINWRLKTVKKKENIVMYDFASSMPVHRSIFGTRITNSLVQECMNNEELKCNYTTFLLTDTNFQKIIYVHYDRLPGRNFGDLIDGLDMEMEQVLYEQETEDPVEDEFPMFDETAGAPTDESVDG